MGASPGKESLPKTQKDEIVCGKEGEPPPGALCPDSTPNEDIEEDEMPGLEEIEQSEYMQELLPFFYSGPMIATVSGGPTSAKEKERVSSNPRGETSPIWVRSGQYSLTPYWRDWALAHLNLEPADLVVDLFSNPAEDESFFQLTGSKTPFLSIGKIFAKALGNFFGLTRPFKACTGPLRKFVLTRAVPCFYVRFGRRPSGGLFCKPCLATKFYCRATLVFFLAR